MASLILATTLATIAGFILAIICLDTYYKAYYRLRANCWFVRLERKHQQYLHWRRRARTIANHLWEVWGQRDLAERKLVAKPIAEEITEEQITAQQSFMNAFLEFDPLKVWQHLLNK